MLINRLTREHDKLRLLGAELLELMETPTPCDPAELARRRWNLARMVHMHLALEERQLFASLASDLRPEVRVASAKARARVEHLHAHYAKHVEHWTAEAVTARWDLFQVAVRTLVRRMNSALAKEEEELFPLVPRPRVMSQDSRQLGLRNWAGDGIAMQQRITECHADRQPLPANDTAQAKRA